MARKTKPQDLPDMSTPGTATLDTPPAPVAKAPAPVVVEEPEPAATSTIPGRIDRSYELPDDDADVRHELHRRSRGQHEQKAADLARDVRDARAQADSANERKLALQVAIGKHEAFIKRADGDVVTARSNADTEAAPVRAKLEQIGRERPLIEAERDAAHEAVGDLTAARSKLAALQKEIDTLKPLVDRAQLADAVAADLESDARAAEGKLTTIASAAEMEVGRIEDAAMDAREALTAARRELAQIGEPSAAVTQAFTKFRQHCDATGVDFRVYSVH